MQLRGRKRSLVGCAIFRVEPVWLSASVRETLQDSDAIRAKVQSAVPGIRIEQNEELVITPFEAELQKAV